MNLGSATYPANTTVANLGKIKLHTSILPNSNIQLCGGKHNRKELFICIWKVLNHILAMYFGFLNVSLTKWLSRFG